MSLCSWRDTFIYSWTYSQKGCLLYFKKPRNTNSENHWDFLSSSIALKYFSSFTQNELRNAKNSQWSSRGKHLAKWNEETTVGGTEEVRAQSQAHGYLQHKPHKNEEFAEESDRGAKSHKSLLFVSTRLVVYKWWTV